MKERISKHVAGALAAQGQKWCPRCKTAKPVTDFFHARGKPIAYCKPCKAADKIAIRKRKALEPDNTIVERFWPKVDKRGPEECWNWIGAKSNRGYGAIYYKGADQPAHRVAMELEGEVVPGPGWVVDHICKNIACVNTKHLRIVLQRDNCTIYANPTPFYKNMTKTHCVHGHPLSGDNIVWVRQRSRGRFGSPSRVCLTCWPHMKNSSYRVDPPDEKLAA